MVLILPAARVTCNTSCLLGAVSPPNQHTDGNACRPMKCVCAYVCALPESLCDVMSWLTASLSVLSPPPAPPLPNVSDSCRLIFLILSISGGRGGKGGCDAEGCGAASLETTPGQANTVKIHYFHLFSFLFYTQYIIFIVVRICCVS